MAFDILSARERVEAPTSRYTLPEAARTALRLASSNVDGSIPQEALAKIEEMRVTFAAKNGGSSFGLN